MSERPNELPASLYPHLERTLLHPAVSIEEQYAAVEEAVERGLGGLVVAPFWVKKWRRELGENHPVRLVTVVGYPFGYQRTETKQQEAEEALNDGADELEIVLNTSALRSPTSVWIKVEWAKLVAMLHMRERWFTVVLEPTFLSPDELTRMIKVAADAGADCIKFGTGVFPQPFSLDVAMRFRRAVPTSVGVKIQGAGASAAELGQLINAGVDRIVLDGPISSLPTP